MSEESVSQLYPCRKEWDGELPTHRSTAVVARQTCWRCLGQSLMAVPPSPCPKSGTTALNFVKRFQICVSVTQVEVLPPSVQVIQSTSVQRANGAVSLKIDRNPHQKHLSRHDRKINPGRLLLALYESSCCYSNFISSSNLKAKHSWNNITALSKNDI